MRQQRRVAVTSPQTRVALAGRRHGVPAAPPHLAPADAERARRIHHRQLRYALTVLGLLGALLLGLPLVLAGAPALDTVRLAGIPISWLAVAVLPFPLMALLAGWQLRKAERAERSWPVGRRVMR
jgi:O-antigen/teichoic acid export membrane protein